MRIGVLALQGGFVEHKDMLERLGVSVAAIKSPREMHDIDGLVIPGGESTTISLLAQRTGLLDPIATLAKSDFPMLGTCAGMIMLADEVIDGRPDRPSFGGIDVAVQRNAFGRQKDSFEAPVSFADLATPFPAVFIRAPEVVRVGPDVTVISDLAMAKSSRERIVGVRQGRRLAVAFHPELTTDTRVHEYFLSIVKGESGS